MIRTRVTTTFTKRRPASVTQLHDSRVPEKIIQERTGHRSLEALRMYEHTNQLQHQAVSAVLSAPSSNTSYTKYIESQKMTLSHTVYQTEQQNLPHFMFHNLHGCTININSAPQWSNTPTRSLKDQADLDADQLIASVCEDYWTLMRSNCNCTQLAHFIVITIAYYVCTRHVYL